MKRFLKVMVITLVLGTIVIGLGLGCASGGDKGSQRLVGVGSFGERPPMLKGDFSLYLVNPHGAGNIIIDKILVVREDALSILELTPGQFETPKGQDNILEPYESWEFVTTHYVDMPPDAKLTYSATVFWHAENDNELVGWWYQKILFGPLPGTEGLPQLTLTQVQMVNVAE